MILKAPAAGQQAGREPVFDGSKFGWQTQLGKRVEVPRLRDRDCFR
jgi:hypothetical protein